MSKSHVLEDQQNVSIHPVGLRKKSDRWKSLPRDIREMLEDSVYRVEDLYLEISRDAKVNMPPVLIHDVGWYHVTGGLCFSRYNYSRVGNRRFFVAELPASTVCCVEDDDILRAILVHEFAHIIWHISDLLEQMDLGDGTVSFKDSKSPDLPKNHVLRDLSTIVNPWDWFGEKDVENFMISEDVRMSSSADLVQNNWIDLGLPMKTSTVVFRLGRIYLDQEIVGRIRRLRASGKRKGPDIKVFIPRES